MKKHRKPTMPKMDTSDLHQCPNCKRWFPFPNLDSAEWTCPKCGHTLIILSVMDVLESMKDDFTPAEYEMTQLMFRGAIDDLSEAEWKRLFELGQSESDDDKPASEDAQP